MVHADLRPKNITVHEQRRMMMPEGEPVLSLIAMGRKIRIGSWVELDAF